MKTPKILLIVLLITLAISIARSASATVLHFTFDGAITGFGSTGPLQTPDGTVLTFAVGDPFTGTAFFDTVPFTFLGAGIDINVGGQHFVGLGSNVSTTSLNSIGFSFGFDASDFASSSPFDLLDYYGGLSASFSSGGSFDFNGLSSSDFVLPSKGFRLTGNITSFQAVPEAGSCGLFLSLALSAILVMRRKMALER
jgi:hypothetical protein